MTLLVDRAQGMRPGLSAKHAVISCPKYLELARPAYDRSILVPSLEGRTNLCFEAGRSISRRTARVRGHPCCAIRSNRIQ
jgi:hypothetical protein